MIYRLILIILSLSPLFVQAQHEKKILSTTFEEGYRVELIEENGHQYILRTPMSLVNKDVNVILPNENNATSTHNQGVSYTYTHHPYSVVPEVQTDELIHSRLLSIPTSMPLAFNTDVRYQVDRLLANRKSMEITIGRASYYLNDINQYLYDNNVPPIMKYLPLIESSYKIQGRSRRGALGLWQFMPATARLYGLKVSSSGDERLDPHKSTPAALTYLADLYEEFNSWELALAAYNCGPGKVQRTIKKSGLSNPTYWDIRHLLPRETQNYLPKFIAAVYVMEHYDQMGLMPHFDGHEQARLEREALQQNNYAFGHTYKVDPGSIPENSVVLTYTVKSGDNLGYIAEWYDVRSGQLRAWNGISGNMIKPGEDIRIYVPADKESVYASINDLSFDKKQDKEKSPEEERQQLMASLGDNDSFVLYTIEKGDTLWDISRKNDISVERLKQINGLSNSRALHPGMVLRIREK